MCRDEKSTTPTTYRASQKDPAKLAVMEETLKVALKARRIRKPFSAVYYADGCIKVSINGEYYGMFDSNSGKFFSGYVGDQTNE